MKKFLGMPIVRTAVSFQALGMHVLSIILFTAIGYFLMSMLLGASKGDVWYYTQQVEKDYFLQGLILFVGVLFSHLIRLLINRRFESFFILSWFDKWFYPIGFILTYLIINEVWGL